MQKAIDAADGEMRIAICYVVFKSCHEVESTAQTRSGKGVDAAMARIEQLWCSSVGKEVTLHPEPCQQLLS